jgi:hypothetical protein
LPVVVAVAEVVEVLRASVLDADGGATVSRLGRESSVWVTTCSRSRTSGCTATPFNNGFVNASVSAYTWAVASYLFGRLKTSRDPTIITPHATINARQR